MVVHERVVPHADVVNFCLSSPGKDINVFVRHLVNELKKLWRSSSSRLYVFQELQAVSRIIVDH